MTLWPNWDRKPGLLTLNLLFLLPFLAASSPVCGRRGVEGSDGCAETPSKAYSQVHGKRALSAPVQSKTRSGRDLSAEILSTFSPFPHQRTPFPDLDPRIEAEKLVLEGPVNQAREWSLKGPGTGLCPVGPAGRAHSCYAVVLAAFSL